MERHPAAGIGRSVHCGRNRMDMVSNYTQTSCIWCSIGTMGPKVYQENIPHTITPPPSAWTTDTRQTRPSNQIGIFTQRSGANSILTISINLRDGYVGKSLQISRFWNTQTSMFGTNSLHSKGTDITFLSYSWFELEQVVWTMSACLNALSCNRVII